MHIQTDWTAVSRGKLTVDSLPPTFRCALSVFITFHLSTTRTYSVTELAVEDSFAQLFVICGQFNKVARLLETPLCFRGEELQCLISFLAISRVQSF